MGTPERRSTGVGWFTSSYSNGNQTCVEVRFRDHAVDVRDTKDRSGPSFSVPAGGWAAFLAGAPDAPLGVERVGDTWVLRAEGAPQTLCFTDAEWRAFTAGVREGEFAVPAV